MGFYHGGFLTENDKQDALLSLTRPYFIRTVTSRALLKRLHPLS